MSPISDKTWMTNGNVYSEVEWDNVVYIGGEFTRVSKCPPESSCPKQTVQVRSNNIERPTVGVKLSPAAVELGFGNSPDASVDTLAACG